MTFPVHLGDSFQNRILKPQQSFVRCGERSAFRLPSMSLDAVGIGGFMEIKQRIDSCLGDLERKQQSVDAFKTRLRQLIDTLKAEGMTPGSLADLLGALESVLQDYSEISSNCRNMIEGLREIGRHIDRVEGGRRKILDGVEAILQNLSHLDRLAQNGLKVGAGSANGKKPKRILLVRISPEEKVPRLTEETDEEDDSTGDTVH